MHGEVYEYQCMLCGDTFADEDSRIAHLRQQHPEHEIIEYRTKTKTRKTRRPRQQGYSYDEDCSDKPNQNKSDQPFSCQECGKRFTTRSSQQIHMRIHTGRCNKLELNQPVLVFIKFLLLINIELYNQPRSSCIFVI